MNDFKNEYKSAMNDITPDRELLDNVISDIENRLEAQSAKKNPFTRNKLAFTAASLLLATGLVSVAVILITSPVNNKNALNGNTDFHLSGSTEKTYSYDEESDDTEYNIIINSDDLFAGYFFRLITVSQLMEMADYIGSLTFKDFREYAYVVKENSTFTVTFYCHEDDTAGESTVYYEDDPEGSSRKSEDYMVKAYFYVDDDKSKPFSVQVSKNENKEDGVFNGKYGIDLVTSADRLYDFLYGDYEEPFNNMTVR